MQKKILGRGLLMAMCLLEGSLPVIAEQGAMPGWNKAPSAVHPYFAEGKAVSGTVDLSPELISRGYAKKDFAFTAADVIFVIARKGSDASAPPVAVARMTNLSGKKFPIKYQIGPDDVMMAGGEPFTGPFSIKVKLSRHGSASTEPGDLIGYSQQKEIKMGSEGVTVFFSEVAGADAPVATSSMPVATGGMGTMPGGHPAIAGKTEVAGTVGAVKPAPIAGEVLLSPELAAKIKAEKFSFSAADAIFVIAKDASAKENTPLAVTKIGNLVGKQFPIPFSLTADDLMSNGEFKGPLLLKAKLARQGGVQTQKGDLFCEYVVNKGSKPGDQGVKIMLTTLAE